MRVQLLIFLAVLSAWAIASSGQTLEATVDEVFVNGGASTANPGTHCLKISTGLLASCNGVVAVPKLSRDLLTASLLAKAKGVPVWIYYVEDQAAMQHCPGVALSPCSLISISSR